MGPQTPSSVKKMSMLVDDVEIKLLSASARHAAAFVARTAAIVADSTAIVTGHWSGARGGGADMAVGAAGGEWWR